MRDRVYVLRNRSNEYFKTWLAHEIAKSENELSQSWKALDRKSSAEGWFKSGRRIHETVEMLGAHLSSLTQRAFQMAVEGEHPSEQVAFGADALENLRNSLFERIPALLRSAAGHPTPTGIESATKSLTDRVRDELLVQIRLATIAVATVSDTPPSRPQGTQVQVTNPRQNKSRPSYAVVKRKFDSWRSDETPSRDSARKWGKAEFGTTIEAGWIDEMQRTAAADKPLRLGRKPKLSRLLAKNTSISES